METYCLKRKKDTKNINPKVSSSSTVKAMILSKCAYVEVKNHDLLKFKKQRDY